VKCSCLNWATHSRGCPNLLSGTRIQGLDLRERERERISRLDLRESFAFSEWPKRSKGVGGGLFIVSTTNRAVGERFTGTSPVNASGSR
jgi:hypothetical protein